MTRRLVGVLLVVAICAVAAVALIGLRTEQGWAQPGGGKAPAGAPKGGGGMMPGGAKGGAGMMPGGAKAGGAGGMMPGGAKAGGGLPAEAPPAAKAAPPGAAPKGAPGVPGAPGAPPAAAEAKPVREPKEQVAKYQEGVAGEAFALFKEGVVAAEDGKIGLASDKFVEAALKDDKFAEPHRRLARIYAAQGKAAWAVDHYQRYLDLKPTAPEAAEVKTRLAKLKAGAKAPRLRSSQPDMLLRSHTEPAPPTFVLGARNQGQTGVKYTVPVMTYSKARF